MPPTLVPAELLPSAMTLRSIASQTAQVAGPALGGLLYGTSAALVYLLAAGACGSACGCVLAIRARPAVPARVGDAQAGAAPGAQAAPGLESVAPIRSPWSRSPSAASLICSA
ncbi:MAG: hypothetical protein ACLPN6_15010 [Streptosporangiaceae bacterium]|jgi:hypothetical protein